MSSWPPSDRGSGALLWAGVAFAQFPLEHIDIEIIPTSSDVLQLDTEGLQDGAVSYSHFPLECRQ